jgi:hypothetical protein
VVVEVPAAESAAEPAAAAGGERASSFPGALPDAQAFRLTLFFSAAAGAGAVAGDLLWSQSASALPAAASSAATGSLTRTVLLSGAAQLAEAVAYDVRAACSGEADDPLFQPLRAEALRAAAVIERRAAMQRQGAVGPSARRAVAEAANQARTDPSLTDPILPPAPLPAFALASVVPTPMALTEGDSDDEESDGSDDDSEAGRKRKQEEEEEEENAASIGALPPAAALAVDAFLTSRNSFRKSLPISASPRPASGSAVDSAAATTDTASDEVPDCASPSTESKPRITFAPDVSIEGTRSASSGRTRVRSAAYSPASSDVAPASTSAPVDHRAASPVLAAAHVQQESPSVRGDLGSRAARRTELQKLVGESRAKKQAEEEDARKASTKRMSMRVSMRLSATPASLKDLMGKQGQAGGSAMSPMGSPLSARASIRLSMNTEAQSSMSSSSPGGSAFGTARSPPFSALSSPEASAAVSPAAARSPAVASLSAGASAAVRRAVSIFKTSIGLTSKSPSKLAPGFSVDEDGEVVRQPLSDVEIAQLGAAAAASAIMSAAVASGISPALPIALTPDENALQVAAVLSKAAPDAQSPSESKAIELLRDDIPSLVSLFELRHRPSVASLVARKSGKPSSRYSLARSDSKVADADLDIDFGDATMAPVSGSAAGTAGSPRQSPPAIAPNIARRQGNVTGTAGLSQASAFGSLMGFGGSGDAESSRTSAAALSAAKTSDSAWAAFLAAGGELPDTDSEEGGADTVDAAFSKQSMIAVERLASAGSHIAGLPVHLTPVEALSFILPQHADSLASFTQSQRPSMARDVFDIIALETLAAEGYEDNDIISPEEAVGLFQPTAQWLRSMRPISVLARLVRGYGYGSEVVAPCEQMLRVYASRGQSRSSLEMLFFMRQAGIVASSECFAAVIESLDRAGAVADAEETYTRLPYHLRHGSGDRCTLELLAVYARHGLVDRAKHLLSQLVATSPTLVTARHYDHLIVAAARSGQLDIASDIVKLLFLASLHRLHGTVRSRFQGAGPDETAAALVAEAEAILGVPAVVDPDINTLHVLMTVCARHGAPEKARAVFEAVVLGDHDHQHAAGSVSSGEHLIWREQDSTQTQQTFLLFLQNLAGAEAARAAALLDSGAAPGVTVLDNFLEGMKVHVGGGLFNRGGFRSQNAVDDQATTGVAQLGPDGSVSIVPSGAHPYSAVHIFRQKGIIAQEVLRPSTLQDTDAPVVSGSAKSDANSSQPAQEAGHAGVFAYSLDPRADTLIATARAHEWTRLHDPNLRFLRADGMLNDPALLAAGSPFCSLDLDPVVVGLAQSGGNAGGAGSTSTSRTASMATVIPRNLLQRASLYDAISILCSQAQKLYVLRDRAESNGEAQLAANIPSLPDLSASVDSYVCLMNAYSRARQPLLARALFDVLEARCHTERSKALAASILMRKKNQPPPAIETAWRLNPAVYEALMTAYARAGDFNGARGAALALAVGGFSISAGAVASLVKALCHHRHTDLGKVMFFLAQDTDEGVDHRELLLKLLSGLVESSERAFSVAPNAVGPSLMRLSSLQPPPAEEGDGARLALEIARLVRGIFVDARTSVIPLQTTPEAYAYLVKFYAIFGKTEKIADVMSQMESTSVPPIPKVYQAVLASSTYQPSFLKPACVQLYQLTLRDRVELCRNNQTASQLVAAFAASGRVAEADHFVKGLVNHSDVLRVATSYRALVAAHIASDNLPNAWECLQTLSSLPSVSKALARVETCGIDLGVFVEEGLELRIDQDLGTAPPVAMMMGATDLLEAVVEEAVMTPEEREEMMASKRAAAAASSEAAAPETGHVRFRANSTFSPQAAEKHMESTRTRAVRHAAVSAAVLELSRERTRGSVTADIRVMKDLRGWGHSHRVAASLICTLLQCYADIIRAYAKRDLLKDAELTAAAFDQLKEACPAAFDSLNACLRKDLSTLLMSDRAALTSMPSANDLIREFHIGVNASASLTGFSEKLLLGTRHGPGLPLMVAAEVLAAPLNALLESLAGSETAPKTGIVAAAWAVIERFARHGVAPTMTTCVSLLRILANSGLGADAESSLDTLIAFARDALSVPCGGLLSDGLLASASVTEEQEDALSSYMTTLRMSDGVVAMRLRCASAAGRGAHFLQTLWQGYTDEQALSMVSLRTRVKALFSHMELEDDAGNFLGESKEESEEEESEGDDGSGSNQSASVDEVMHPRIAVAARFLLQNLTHPFQLIPREVLNTYVGALADSLSAGCPRSDGEFAIEARTAVQAARTLIRTMAEAGACPDVFTSASMVRLYAAAGLVSEGRSLLRVLVFSLSGTAYTKDALANDLIRDQHTCFRVLRGAPLAAARETSFWNASSDAISLLPAEDRDLLAAASPTNHAVGFSRLRADDMKHVRTLLLSAEKGYFALDPSSELKQTLGSENDVPSLSAETFVELVLTAGSVGCLEEIDTLIQTAHQLDSAAGGTDILNQVGATAAYAAYVLAACVDRAEALLLDPRIRWAHGLKARKVTHPTWLLSSLRQRWSEARTDNSAADSLVAVCWRVFVPASQDLSSHAALPAVLNTLRIIGLASCGRAHEALRLLEYHVHETFNIFMPALDEQQRAPVRDSLSLLEKGRYPTILPEAVSAVLEAVSELTQDQLLHVPSEDNPASSIMMPYLQARSMLGDLETGRAPGSGEDDGSSRMNDTGKGQKRDAFDASQGASSTLPATAAVGTAASMIAQAGLDTRLRQVADPSASVFERVESIGALLGGYLSRIPGGPGASVGGLAASGHGLPAVSRHPSPATAVTRWWLPVASDVSALARLYVRAGNSVGAVRLCWGWLEVNHAALAASAAPSPATLVSGPMGELALMHGASSSSLAATMSLSMTASARAPSDSPLELASVWGLTSIERARALPGLVMQDGKHTWACASVIQALAWAYASFPIISFSRGLVTDDTVPAIRDAARIVGVPVRGRTEKLLEVLQWRCKNAGGVRDEDISSGLVDPDIDASGFIDESVDYKRSVRWAPYRSINELYDVSTRGTEEVSAAARKQAAAADSEEEDERASTALRQIAVGRGYVHAEIVDSDDGSSAGLMVTAATAADAARDDDRSKPLFIQPVLMKLSGGSASVLMRRLGWFYQAPVSLWNSEAPGDSGPMPLLPFRKTRKMGPRLGNPLVAEVNALGSRLMPVTVPLPQADRLSLPSLFFLLTSCGFGAGTTTRPPPENGENTITLSQGVLQRPRKPRAFHSALVAVQGQACNALMRGAVPVAGIRQILTALEAASPPLMQRFGGRKTKPASSATGFPPSSGSTLLGSNAGQILPYHPTTSSGNDASIDHIDLTLSAGGNLLEDAARAQRLSESMLRTDEFRDRERKRDPAVLQTAEELEAEISVLQMELTHLHVTTDDSEDTLARLVAEHGLPPPALPAQFVSPDAEEMAKFRTELVAAIERLDILTGVQREATITNAAAKEKEAESRRLWNTQLADRRLTKKQRVDMLLEAISSLKASEKEAMRAVGLSDDARGLFQDYAERSAKYRDEELSALRQLARTHQRILMFEKTLEEGVRQFGWAEVSLRKLAEASTPGFDTLVPASPLRKGGIGPDAALESDLRALRLQRQLNSTALRGSGDNILSPATALLNEARHLLGADEQSVANAIIRRLRPYVLGKPAIAIIRAQTMRKARESRDKFWIERETETARAEATLASALAMTRSLEQRVADLRRLIEDGQRDLGSACAELVTAEDSAGKLQAGVAVLKDRLTVLAAEREATSGAVFSEALAKRTAASLALEAARVRAAVERRIAFARRMEAAVLGVRKDGEARVAAERAVFAKQAEQVALEVQRKTEEAGDALKKTLQSEVAPLADQAEAAAVALALRRKQLEEELAAAEAELTDLSKTNASLHLKVKESLDHEAQIGMSGAPPALDGHGSETLTSAAAELSSRDPKKAPWHPIATGTFGWRDALVKTAIDVVPSNGLEHVLSEIEAWAEFEAFGECDPRVVLPKAPSPGWLEQRATSPAEQMALPMLPLVTEGPASSAPVSPAEYFSLQLLYEAELVRLNASLPTPEQEQQSASTRRRLDSSAGAARNNPNLSAAAASLSARIRSAAANDAAIAKTLAETGSGSPAAPLRKGAAARTALSSSALLAKKVVHVADLAAAGAELPAATKARIAEAIASSAAAAKSASLPRFDNAVSGGTGIGVPSTSVAFGTTVRTSPNGRSVSPRSRASPQPSSLQQRLQSSPAYAGTGGTTLRVQAAGPAATRPAPATPSLAALALAVSPSLAPSTATPKRGNTILHRTLKELYELLPDGVDAPSPR